MPDRAAPSDSAERSSSEITAPLPDELPPVQPPSAGFIIQLFVIPALIVAAVIGVVSLPRLLVKNQQDWRQLVSELGSSNEHRRWRAALGLAQVLRADEELRDKGQHLAQSPEIATALASLMQEQLKLRSHDEAEIKQQAFVARTLGFLDAPDTVLPVLQESMQPEHDIDIRRNAIASIALVAGRADERQVPLDRPKLVDDLIVATGDPEPPIRHLAVYTLGLMPSEAARQRLEVLVGLEREDRQTRVNAAIGLARHGSTAGADLFRAVLRRPPPMPASETDQTGSREFEEFVILRNTIKAVELLAPKFSAAERTQFVELLTPIAADHPEPQIELDAQTAIAALQSLES